MPSPNAPLSDDELQELDHILLHEIKSDEAMTIDMMDGFMHALAIGPTTIMPSQWLPLVWGSDGPMPAIESMEKLNHILGLVMRHFNGIVSGLDAKNPEVFPFWPFFASDPRADDAGLTDNEAGHETDDDGADADDNGEGDAHGNTAPHGSADGDANDFDDDFDDEDFDEDEFSEDEEGGIEYDDASAWAMGFIEGMQQCWDDWQPMLQTPQGQAWFRPIYLLGSEDIDESELTLIDTPEKRADLSLQIPDALLAMHAYWLPYRQAVNERETARTLQTKVGRNHPCPCGSGRKFRKCCGAAAELQ